MVSILATVLAGVGSALNVLGAIVAGLLTLVGLVRAALLALGGYLLYTTDAGQQAL